MNFHAYAKDFFICNNFFFSFNIGDVFSVQNVLDEDWLWVVSQKDNKSGLVPKALTEEVVNKYYSFIINVILLTKTCKSHVYKRRD